MFELKFCLKTFETCSLLYESVLKCCILATILFEYLLLDQSAKGLQIVQRELKNSRRARSLPFTFHAYGSRLGVALI